MKYPLMKNNITKKDLSKVIDYLKNDDPILTNSKKCLEFEKRWSDWLDVKYSVFVNSGSSANLLSLTLLKMKFPNGGEVIVPPLTWVSDISSVIQTGFKPVFADIKFENLGMDTNLILKKINKNTRAIFLTYAQGFNCLTKSLLKELKKRNIYLIEDVCESHGATFNGKKLGSFGWTSNFSFYYAHHMSTIEGGMVCTNDEETYQNLRMLRSHGLVREMTNKQMKDSYVNNNPFLNPSFIFTYPSYNFRNTEIGGILGISQLKRIDKNIKLRNDNFLYFLDNLKSDKFFKDYDLKGSSNYAFNLMIREKDQNYIDTLMKQMLKNGVEFRRGSAGGGNQLRQPYLKNIIDDRDLNSFPNTDHIHFFGFYLGNYPSFKKIDIKNLTKIINSA